jgi:glycosyltransferase involved in cell wall biosynthesis
VFSVVRDHMPPPFVCRAVECRHVSRGIVGRVANVLDAPRHQGDVNHVTGDVHYVDYFLHRRRTLLTIHDCVGLHRLRGLRRYLLWLLWYRLPVLRAGMVSVGSPWAKDEILRHVDCDPERVRIVPHCVSPHLAPSPRERRSVPVVLQVGTGANKNLTRLAAALEGVPCRLHIVGEIDAEQREALARARIPYGVSAKLTDDDMIRAYHACDIVAFVSTYEGFGLPIIEAQAVGRPVVTSVLGPMPWVAGRGACLVDPCSPEAIRHGILRVLGDPQYADDLVRLGFENVARFQPDLVARAYAALYRELLEAAS